MSFPHLVRSKPPAAGALTERTDDELMRLAQAGLREAFAVLVERHADRVLTLCGRFAGEAQLGRELAQDTWVLVWQGRSKYRAEGTFVAWLITVARNHCRNQLRRRKVTLSSELELLPADAATSSEQLDRLLVEERRQRVRGALADLPVAMREALLLRYGEGLRYDEMTAVVGAGESTLRSRVHHGLKILKQKLEKGS
jgi:RNA polymerase sigma-70 factor (ECF subfamily)